MSKIVLPTVVSADRLTAINDNFQKVEDALNLNVLYRDNLPGEPNSMSDDLDMNGRRVYNLPVPTLSHEAARLADVQNAITSGNAANLITVTPAGTISSTNVQAALQELDGDVQGILNSDRFRSDAFIAGDETLSGATLRDAYVVGRNVTGLTDCHAFADRTVIDGVTDSGTYGVFDATTKLRGAHTQNHLYTYQDRIAYQGSGTLTETASLYSATVHSGSGTISARYGVSIYDCIPSAGGVLSAQIGLYVRNLTGGTSNVGLNIAQAAGYAIFANGGAKSLHTGRIGIGAEADASTMLHVEGGSGGSNAAIYVNKTTGWSFYHPGTGKLHNNGEGGFGLQQNIDSVALTVAGEATGPRAYIDTTTTQAFFGATGGDYPLGFVANGATRLELTASATAYTLQPGADNTQPLGAAGKRWSVVYSGTGAINTSDAREKEQVRMLSTAERAAAVRCKGLLKAFKFTSSVVEKGTAARIHFGVLAQDVAAAFTAEGLNAENYALFCYDEYPATFDTNGQQLTPAGNRYGIRYDELLCFMIATL